MGSSAATLTLRDPRIERACRIAGVAAVDVVLLVPFAISIRAGAYNSFVDDALAGWGMWGAFVIYAWTRPPRRELAATVAIGCALRAAYALLVGEHGYQGSAVIGMGAFLGPACLGVLIVRSLQAPSENRAVCRRSLGVIGLLSYIGVSLGFYIPFATFVLPRKLDYFLYNFDASLGFQPSAAAWKLVHGFWPLYWLEVMVYNSLGFWFALIYAVHANDRLRYPIAILKLFIANALIGFSLYFFFPAMGPRYAFPSFPKLPGTVPSAAALLSGVPNAMPSLHFAGALLIFWLAKPWKWLYRLTGAFAALTALATLGLGEHYLIDLVVAIPYALAIFAFSSNSPDRKAPLTAGAALVLFWICFLRTGIVAPAISCTLVALTVGSGWALQKRLAARLWTAEG